MAARMLLSALLLLAAGCLLNHADAAYLAPPATVLWLKAPDGGAYAGDCHYTCSYHGLAHVSGGDSVPATSTQGCTYDPNIALCGFPHQGNIKAGTKRGNTCDVHLVGSLPNRFYCGCVPKEHWFMQNPAGNSSPKFSVWTNGPAGLCPGGYTLTSAPFGAVCRYRISNNVYLGYVRTVNGVSKCYYRASGLDQTSNVFDRLCVRSTFAYAASL